MVPAVGSYHLAHDTNLPGAMSNDDLIFHADFAEQTADSLVLQASDGTCFAFSLTVLAKHSSFFACLPKLPLPSALPASLQEASCKNAERTPSGDNDGDPCDAETKNQVSAAGTENLPENNDGTQQQSAECCRTPKAHVVSLLYPSAPALNYILRVVKSEEASSRIPRLGDRRLVPFQVAVYSREQLDEVLQTAEAFDMLFIFKWMSAWMVNCQDWPREVIRTIVAVGCRSLWAQVDMDLQRNEGFQPLDEWSRALLVRLAPNQLQKLLDREEAVHQFKQRVINGCGESWPESCRLAELPCLSMSQFGADGYRKFVEDALDYVLLHNSPFTGYFRRAQPILELCRNVAECQKCGNRLGHYVWGSWYFRPSMGLNRNTRLRRAWRGQTAVA